MKKLTASDVMQDPAGRIKIAKAMIKAIPEVIQRNSAVVTAAIMGEDDDGIVVRAGALDVFFRIVHGLPDTTFIQYGHLVRAPDGGRAMCPVGEWQVEELVGLVIPTREFVAQNLFRAIADVANAVVDRYGQNARIHNGAVLEPVPETISA